MPVTVVKRCSICGTPGHRFETCPVRPPGMTAPPKRPTTVGDRARAAGREPPPLKKPRAGSKWKGYLEPVEGFEGLALRRLSYLQHETEGKRRTMAKPDTTPLTDTLDEWTAKYALTPEEREVLFNKTLDVMPPKDLARLSGIPVDEIHARGASVAKKTGEKRLSHSALRLCREALALATFDHEKRNANREENDQEVDDG